MTKTNAKVTPHRAATPQEKMPTPDVNDDGQIVADPIPHYIIIDSLKNLYKAFGRAAAKHPPLNHQQLIPPYFATGEESENSDPEELASDVEEDSASMKEWAAFAAANSPAADGGWQEWHGPVEGEYYEWFGRFSGHRDGMDEFRFLASTFYLVLRKLDPKLPEGGGYERLLDMMHQAAASWPTTFLRSTQSEWGLDVAGSPDSETAATDCDELWKKSDVGPSGVPFFVHPAAMTIEGNVFRAAAQFVKMIARDDLTLFLSDMHPFEPDYPIVREDDDGKDATGKSDGRVDFGYETAQSDYVFAFDVKRKVWHVRFRYDKAPDAIEEDWLPDHIGMKYISYLLERPNIHIPSTSIPSSRLSRQTKTSKQQYESQVEDSDERRNHSGRQQAWQNKAEFKTQMEKLALEIKEARVEADRGNQDEVDQVIRLENEFKALEKQYRQNFDKFGRPRESVDSTDQKATNRVRNRINKIKGDCSDENPHRKFDLIHFATFLDKQIICCGPNCLYTDKSPKEWVIGYPPGLA